MSILLTIYPLPTLGQHHGYSLLNWVNHVYPSHHLPPPLPYPRSTPWLQSTELGEPCLSFSPSTPPPPPYPRSTPWLQSPELGEPCLSFSPSTPLLLTLGQHHGYSLLNCVNHVYPSHHLPPPYPRSTPWLQSPELGEPCLSFSPSTPSLP